jgi:hypothetical protein
MLRKRPSDLRLLQPVVTFASKNVVSSEEDASKIALRLHVFNIIWGCFISSAVHVLRRT